MSVDTHGKLKGFVRHQDILSFIQKKWDPNAKSNIKKQMYGTLNVYDNIPYQINPHSDDIEHYYVIAGFIFFTYQGEKRMLFYDYDNINTYENLEYYQDYGLEEMVRTETTFLSLGAHQSSIDIIKDILRNFNGGWLDEDDCDDEEYYVVEPNPCKIGGIYHDNETDEYLIVLDINYEGKSVNGYKLTNIPDNVDNVSNTDIQVMLNFEIKTFTSIDYLGLFWSKSFDTFVYSIDGYLGQIPEEQLHKLKDMFVLK